MRAPGEAGERPQRGGRRADDPGAEEARQRGMVEHGVGGDVVSAAGARRQGMTDTMLGELMAVVGMANETNRLANGYQVEIDDMFRTPPA